MSIRDTDEKRDGLAAGSGVIVMHVTDRSPADVARLQKGDRVFAIDGEPVGGTEHFKQIMAQKQGGQTVAIDVAREQAVLRVALKPADWPQ